MELVYLWVEDYKNIKRQGFNFSPRFYCHYDGETLIINENDDYIPDFFGKNINITAIVGKNGSGKSSVLECLNILLNPSLTKEEFTLAEEGGSKELAFDAFFTEKTLANNFILLAVDKEKFHYQSSEEEVKFNFNNKYIKPKDYIYTSSYIYKDELKFKRIIPQVDDRGMVKNGMQIMIDLSAEQNYNHLSLNSHDINNMIIETFKKSFKLTSFMYIPNKVKITPCNIDEIFFNSFGIEEDFRHGSLLEKETKEKFSNIINSYHKFLIIWYIKNYGENWDILENKEVLSEIYFDETIELDEDLVVYEQDFKDYFTYKTRFLNELTEKEKNIYFYNFSHFFELNFIDNLNRDFNKLSYGEKIIFGIFLNIYYISDFYYKDSEILFFLDESDIFLHPSWQKKYIKELYLLLVQLKHEFHIILTSHSPFLLSDIPKQNIIFLDKDEKGNCKVVNGLKEKKQTFGANIHTLLSDSFFMEEGLMGEFAKGKIDDVINYLHDRESTIKSDDEAQKLIHIIGEPIVKNQLQRMLDSKRLKKVDEIEVIKKSMEAMQKRLDELEYKTPKKGDKQS